MILQLDAKRSPLALLAQTCSQIGADPTPQSASAATSAPSTTTVTVGTNSSTAINHHQTGKPESSLTTKSSNSSKRSASDPDKSSKTPPAVKHHPYDFVPSKEDAVITVNKEHHKTGFKSPKSVNSSAGSPPSSSAVLPTPSPIVPEPPRSYDPLAGYRPAPMFPGLYNPYDALGAFRHPAYSHLGYPPSLGLSLAGYQQALAQSSYAAAAATAAAAAARKPDQVCRDPYCTGCPASTTPSVTTTATSTTSPSVSTAAPCPAGCTQCTDHLQNKTSVSSILTSTSTTTASTTSSSRPYVCNWIAADNYCGKRFTSSEELLQHLRTHTSLAAESSPATSSYSPLQLQPPSHLLASSALHRSAYPTPPLSPLSMAARYHPYAAKPPTAAAAAVGSPGGAVPPPPPNPLLTLHHPYAHHPGLSAYYGHPYASLYSQRMLGSGVLP